jgi:hypothetical protein
LGLALDPVNKSLEEAHRRLKEDFNLDIQNQILVIEDVNQSIVDIEKLAGDERIREAEAVNGNIREVNRLNALKLDEIWEGQTETLKDLADELRGGTLSGLTTAAQVDAANDNFKRTLALVRGGNLSEFENLETFGRSTVDLATQAFGNAPRTAGLRSDVLEAIDEVLESRSFAKGTDNTPPGWIRVGETGPEWLYQSGGLGVLSNSSSPSSMGKGEEVGNKLDRMINLLEGGNRISQTGLLDLFRGIQALLVSNEKKVISEPKRRMVG